MTPRLRRGLVLSLRAALVAGVIAACVWFLRRIDLPAVWAALAHAAWAPLGAAVLLNLVGVWARGARFGVMLADAPGRRIPTTRLFRYHLAAFAASNLLPGRAGEVVRVFLLNRREAVPAASAASAAVVEKVFDVMAMVLLLGPVPLLLPGLPRSVSTAVGVLAAIGAAALALVIVAARLDGNGGGDTLLARVARGARVMRRPRAFALALGQSLLIWGADVAVVLLCLRGIGLGVPWAGALLVLLTLNLAVALPSTPGQVGAFEAGAVVALRILGAPEEPSVAFALIYHAVQAIPVTVLGAPGLRLAGAAARARAATEPAPPHEGTAG